MLPCYTNVQVTLTADYSIATYSIVECYNLTFRRRYETSANLDCEESPNFRIIVHDFDVIAGAKFRVTNREDNIECAPPDRSFNHVQRWRRKMIASDIWWRTFALHSLTGRHRKLDFVIHTRVQVSGRESCGRQCQGAHLKKRDHYCIVNIKLIHKCDDSQLKWSYKSIRRYRCSFHWVFSTERCFIARL